MSGYFIKTPSDVRQWGMSTYGGCGCCGPSNRELDQDDKEDEERIALALAVLNEAEKHSKGTQYDKEQLEDDSTLHDAVFDVVASRILIDARVALSEVQ